MSLIGAIGEKKVSSGFTKPEEKEEQSKKVAYMGPNIGALLNGSAQQPTDASAVRA